MKALKSYAVPQEIKDYYIVAEKKRRQKKPFANTEFRLGIYKILPFILH